MNTQNAKKKVEVLQCALSQREDEIFAYQINIDNYALAIDKIDDPDLEDFKEQLKKMLATEIIEQKKSIVIRDVIAQQLTELE